MNEFDECRACYQRGKEGFERLFGENHEKTLESAMMLAYQTYSGNALVMEFRTLLVKEILVQRRYFRR